MEIRNLTCIGCPMGCPLTVKLEDTEVINIEGKTCKRKTGQSCKGNRNHYRSGRNQRY